MDITLRELLTTYWPQMVAVGSLFAFFVTRILDLRGKRIETKQSLFQQRRFEVIMEFVKHYVFLQGLYRKMITLEGKEPIVNLAPLVEHTEAMYTSYFYLRFFLDPLEMARYTDLMITMNEMIKHLSPPDKKDVRAIVADMLKKNAENFNVITEMFRKNASDHKAIELK